MIWLDDKKTTIRIQGSSKMYLKLNDGKETFKWFYDAASWYGFIQASPTMLVEWLDEEN